MNSIRQRLFNLRSEIATFDHECEAEEHTDTGDVWDLFNRIRTELTDILGNHNGAELGALDQMERKP